MGRVARYKKIKSCDPFSKGGRIMPDIWGLGDDGRKPKKISKTAEKLRMKKKRYRLAAASEQAQQELQQQKDGKKKKKKVLQRSLPILEQDGFDLPLEGGDEYDTNDPVGSVNKIKPESFEPSQKPVASQTASERIVVPIPKASGDQVQTQGDVVVPQPNIPDESEEKMLNRVLKLESQISESGKATGMDMSWQKRRPGESKNAYIQRFRLEHAKFLKEQQKKEVQNTDKRQRKKEFLNNKKKKKKKSKQTQSSSNARNGDDDDDDDDLEDDDDEAVNVEELLEAGDDKDTLMTGERALALRAAATAVQFGEQAERPPVFRQLPRGASSKESKPGKKELESKEKEMERLRAKVQAQYALIRQKRRGNFHL